MPVVAMLAVLFVAPATQATPLTCNMSTISGDDDGSFPLTLPFSLRLGETDYNQVYYSTNGTMTFGRPDGNFSSYPNTPSVSLAGYDWVSWGPGAYTSYGYNESSFCIEWSVRPFPQSSGDLTQIRLVVNKFSNGSWHGEITTIGWLPNNLRRGIRAIEGGAVVTMEAAFDVNGGAPIEVPPAPAPTSFTEPPAIPTQCWNGSTVYAPATCPVEPSFTCWDGTTTHYASECAPEPHVTCWDGSSVHYQSECSTEPVVVCWDNTTVHYASECSQEPVYVCWDGSTTHYSSECLPEPVVICWDNSQVHYQSECSPVPPDIVCWNDEVVAWNGTCPQMPPPVECWDGSEVNWDEQCPVQPLVYPSDAIKLTANEGWTLEYTPPTGMRIGAILFASYGTPNEYQYGSCHAPASQFIVENYLIGNTSLSIRAVNNIFGDPCGGTYKRLSVVLTIEPDPNWTPSPEPTPTETETVQPTPTITPEPTPSPSEVTPSPTVEPTVEPSPSETPTPTPSPSESETQAPVVVPTSTPEPTPSTPSEAPTPQETQSPSPEASPSFSPSDNLTTEEAVAEILTEYTPLEAVPFDVLLEAGLDYSDLPPEQPVMLENGVILTAEVADALQLFENPSEIFSTVLTDPGKAIKAFLSVGADMTPTQRHQSTQAIVAAVIAGQLMNALSSANMIGRKL